MGNIDDLIKLILVLVILAVFIWVVVEIVDDDAAGALVSGLLPAR